MITPAKFVRQSIVSIEKLIDIFSCIKIFLKEKDLRKYTENTMTDKKSLLKELEKIRKQGYAIDNLEHEEGVRCVPDPFLIIVEK